jgi:anti-anti-sigma factor
MSERVINLDVDIEDSDEERVAHFDGAVDVFTAGTVARRVFTGLPHDARRVVIDLRRVQFMDSAGLSAVVRLAERAKRHAIDMRAQIGQASHLNPTVRAMLRRVVVCLDDPEADQPAPEDSTADTAPLAAD